MVKTNIQTFSGEVEILSNLHVGNYLTANGAASNVLEITGNVGATFFVGDGGFLSNIATTLNDITNQGNVISNVVTFEANTHYGGVGFVTSSNVGIQNTNPLHTLHVGDKVIFDDNTVESSGQSVIQVDGRISATRFQGDGGLLSNIATTLSSIVNQGNTASNCIILESNAHYNGVGLVTSSNVGIQNSNPTFDLSVGSNLHVDDTGANVLTVHGNVTTNNLNLGVFSITPAYGLNDVCSTSNGTSNVVQFQNSNTSIVTTSNINVGGQVIITGATKGLDVTSNIELGGRLKFDSNVFIDTLRVADVAANLVTYDRVTGELTDSGGTFLNKFAIVSEQPPSDLFANATTVANHGGYTLTTSNLATNSNTYNAFDGTANAWTGGTGMYVGGSNVLIETNLTQLSNLHPTQFGDWLAIEFPYKTTLRHMKLTPATVWQSFPYAANLYATNNDLTWTEIGYWDGLNPGSASNVQTITVNATEQFKKYALVTTKLVPQSTSVASAVSLQDWQLFTESFSIDGGKVAMAQQAATGGETVMDQHGPHGRLPKAVPLKKYPEIAFEEGKFDSNDSTNTYVQAGYTVSASRSQTAIVGENLIWEAFNGIASKIGMLLTGNNYDNDGNANTTGTTASRLSASDSTPHGEWLKLKLPNKIKLNKYVFTSRNDTTNWTQSAEAGQVWGSDNDSDWVHLHTFTNSGFTGASQTASFNVTTNNYYKYYAFIVTKTFAAGTNGYLCIPELEYYGYEEDPPFLGDTSVDTTFTSIMNTPQTTGAQVYVDGSLGETFTNRVVGPTVSNTHTTYVSTEKYWELSGNVESNVTLEANTFLSGDAPHSLSMWFNSSNLEANVSNSCIFSLGTEERFDHIGIGAYQLLSNTYQTVQKFTASDGAAGDRFGAGDGGNSLGMSGDGSVVVVGANYDDSQTGAAYMFIKDANGYWNEVQKLKASDATVGDRFGFGVDISTDGNYIAIGARLAHSTDGNNTSHVGKLYIFKRNVGTNSWSEQQILSSSHESQDDGFGRHVSISSDGTYVVAVAPNDDETVSNGGAAYVFKRTGNTWNTTPFRLISGDVAANDYIGSSIQISNDGNFVAVGVMDEDGVGTNDDGSVYIFARTGDNTWVQQQKINNPSPSGNDNYFGGSNRGVSLSSDGTYLVVGAYGQANPSYNTGAVFFFQRTGSSTSDWTWSLMGSVQNDPQGTTGNQFGRAVVMSPDGLTALVHSADDVGGTDVGAVFVYKRSGTTWTYKHKIQHTDQTASDFFGSALAISTDGSYFVAGMNYDDDLGDRAGAAYIYTRDEYGHPSSPAKLKLQSNTWHNLTYAYQGEGGSKVTYLDGRKVVDETIEDTYGEYPPFAMTGYSQGGYVVSASQNSSSYEVWRAFNNTSGFWLTGTGEYPSGVYDSSVTGLYNLGTLTGGGSTDNGHYLKLELPHKLKISYVNMHARTSYEPQAPKNFKFYGSNDDTNWEQFGPSFSNEAPQDDGTSYYTLNSIKAYKFIGLVVTETVGDGNGRLSIEELKLYGHRENDLVRLPDPTNVLKYPHVALTGPAQRGYVASASSTQTGVREAWNAFDGGDVMEWRSSGADYTGSDGIYVGTAHRLAATDTDGAAIPYGEWLQIKMPNKILLQSIKLVGDTGFLNKTPEDFKLYGSTNGSTWKLLITQTGLTPTTGGNIISPASALSVRYDYYALVTTKLFDANQTDVAIEALEFYGTEEGSVPIQIGGGNIDRVANFRVYDKFVGEDQALEIWDAQKDEFGRAKSSMTLQKGRLGIGTTEPEGRLAVADEPNTFEPRWPPKPLVGYKTYIEGHGEFCVHRSGNESGGEYRGNSWWIFDDNQNTHNWTYHGERVAGTNDSYFKGTNGEYTGGKSIGGVAGDWNVLESPNPIKINDIIRMRVRSAGQATKGFVIAAANKFDGVWTKLTEQSNLVWQTGGVGESKTFHFENDKYYKYYAIIITQAPSINGFPTLSNMEFSGIVQQGQSVLHDGQLTLTKNLTVPRIGPALDADDTPRRDRLVVEYNTSTNPTFEGAVRDTSGRGNDALLIGGGAVYDANEKCLTVTTADHDIQSVPLNNPGGAYVHSFSIWFKLITINRVICQIGADSQGVSSGLYINNNNINYYFFGNDQNFVVPGSFRNLDVGSWNHIVATYDGGSLGGSRRLWFNGNEITTGSIGATTTAAAANIEANTTVHVASRKADTNRGSSVSNFKLYDCALTAEEAKTLYDMGRCDEGHHVVNFSKTRVGIGLGDGEAPMGDLDVRGHVCIGPKVVPISDWFNPALTIVQHSTARSNGRPGAGIQFGHIDDPGHGWMLGLDNDSPSGIGTGNEFVFEHLANGTQTGYGGQLSSGYTVNTFNDFTGQHRCFIKDVPFSQAGDLEGLIVSSDQNKYIKMSGGIEAGSNAITTNESLPVVSLSNVATDKKCFGVISAAEDPEQRSDAYGIFKSFYPKEKGDTRVYINSVGEGAIWVSNIGGNLEAGDYITTSNVAGYGQKQDDDVLHNYTVAKITMDCDFNPVTQPVQQILRSNVIQTYYLGNVHKVKTVPHEFVTTTVGVDDTWSNVSVSPSDVTYAEWSNLEANTQNTYTLTYTQTSNVVYDTKYTLTTTANVTESDPWDSVFVDPPSVTYAEYSNLEANTQSSYSLTFTKTTTDEKTPDEWSALESNTQSLYNMVYYQSVEEEVASDYPGATTHTRVTDVIENELDAHGQIQWEDHATETEKAYKIRYLDVSGAQTDSANAVHIAAHVECTFPTS